MSNTKHSRLERYFSKNQIQEKRAIIQQIKEQNQLRLEQAKRDVDSPNARRSGTTDQIKQIERTRCISNNTGVAYKKQIIQDDKNVGISDTDKMLFDKKFKNYLNHKKQFDEQAKKRREKIIQGRKKQENQSNEEDEYFNEEQLLSNNDSDYQYHNANDMKAAYDQMTTGKKRKGKQAELFHCQRYENQFRQEQFKYLLKSSQQENISKDQFLNYLFDEPMVMMLYSINPYQLGDQLAQFETEIQNKLNYTEFSNFLLTDREPTYFDYDQKNLQQARKIGRGIKCAPIKGKWINQTGIYNLLIDIYKSIDMHGDGKVDRNFLAKKIRRELQPRRLCEVQVIEIVNINKFIPLSRLIYEIQFEIRGEQGENWTFEEFQSFLVNYKRLNTPEKDKLITKLILAGKYDSSYVYVLSQEALEIIKDVFQKMPKFAEYFVSKEKFLQKLCSDSRYKKIQDMNVRSQSNRYVHKQTVEQTLVRLYAEGDIFLDIEEVLDFFTNRGRPKIVEYQVYIANLERQLKMIEQQEKLKKLMYGDDFESTSSDDEFQKTIKQKRINRKKQKLIQIKNANVFGDDKKFKVTIPVPFNFDINQKHKVLSIRERKVKEMIDQKKRLEDQSMVQFKAKDVPAHVKQNLYQKMLKDQERERKQRLQRFRLQIMSQVHVSERLMRPLSTELHCDFSHVQYKFTARPMPWYCEVNLLDRINKQKQQRKQKILEELIKRNTDFDLPEGVQKMIERQEQLANKRAQKRTVSTKSKDYTFQPRISQGVPDFKTIHEHLHFDLENAKNAHQPIQAQPFSFENRQSRSRTTHQNPKNINRDHPQYSKYQKLYENQQDFMNIPKNQKFDALVSLRRKQQNQRKKIEEQEKRAEAVRKLRQEKFAPIVRKALQKTSNDPTQSRIMIAEKIKQFKREQKQKKLDYENEMIKIYTKVFQRPLLVETGASNIRESRKQKDEELPLKKSKNNQKDNQRQMPAYYEDQSIQRQKKLKASFNPNRQFEKEQQRIADEKRRAAVEVHQGQYPPDEFQYDHPDYQEDQNIYEEDLSQNAHTS